MLAVSRALLHRPGVLLLDEPTTGIDSITLRTMTNFVKNVAGETTVIIITHEVEALIAPLSDSICVLEHGRVVETGTHAQLSEKEGLYARLLLAERMRRGDVDAGPPHPSVQPLSA